jgi:PIN domain nuclease of toxin-antitoxin system
MRLMLDTNILIPIIHETFDAIPLRLREAVQSSGASLHASVASLWEIAIKVRLQKLALRVSLRELPELMVSLNVALLTIDAVHVLADLEDETDTRDPFDRLLLAQCQVEDLRLVTTDRMLAVHPLAWRPT